MTKAKKLKEINPVHAEVERNLNSVVPKSPQFFRYTIKSLKTHGLSWISNVNLRPFLKIPSINIYKSPTSLYVKKEA